MFKSGPELAALADAALKAGSECSFTCVNSASSPAFALPRLRSLRSAPLFMGARRTGADAARS
ncbi:hypothetical protein D3880_02090 [Pseudomonas cavernae]|uniref:Uncharacterized protein n=1 Tax=Pseudomonas cavernae TaxID=2320867 RepID=A0A385YY93_9PSED|nr:hypothetical protein D3880_02090 [Pseudomonas cavernae]